VEDAREKRLRDGVVQVARNPPALFQSPLAFPALRLRRLGGRAFAFADGRAEEETGERDDEDVELRAHSPLVNRLAEEHPRAWAVIPIVRPALIATASATPGGPNRNAAQITAGKIR